MNSYQREQYFFCSFNHFTYMCVWNFSSTYIVIASPIKLNWNNFNETIELGGYVNSLMSIHSATLQHISTGERNAMTWLVWWSSENASTSGIWIFRSIVLFKECPSGCGSENLSKLIFRTPCKVLIEAHSKSNHSIDFNSMNEVCNCKKKNHNVKIEMLLDAFYYSLRNGQKCSSHSLKFRI